MNWDANTLDKFKLMISKIPVFHRAITEEVVTRRSLDNAKARGASQVEEKLSLIHI